MTLDQTIADLVNCYNQTLEADPDLATADLDGFMAWAWSDDEPLLHYALSPDEYEHCLQLAYAIVQK